ncbi:uncharacterized protein [Phyllobates terribilis]|uniref:uncharacterized protein n=1 Tax=Phyllobates terribilis TaxID=111132 RepID=UPI003CCAD50E
MRGVVVGIFSREGDSSFSFLSDALRTKDSFKEVRSFTITNSGLCQFREEVSRCDYAILYHSKNRGRLNITNVTDSLYDEEITHLSRELGRENVIVVADDLDCSSSEMRTRILQGQPLIEEMAAGLFLISKEDKNSPELLNEKLHLITSCISRKAFKKCGKNQSVPAVMDLVQHLFYVPGPVVAVVMSAILFSYNTFIIWVMMPVRALHIVYNQSIQGIMVVMSAILFSYNTVIIWVMMPVRALQLVCNESILGVMMVRKFVLIIYHAITGPPRYRHT